VSAPRVHVLIPAAGSGTRFGSGVLKQYQPVCGEAVLAHVIGIFKHHPMVTSITVVLAEDDQWFESAVGSLSVAVNKVTGGATRAQSVLNGLNVLSQKYSGSDWVLVHDAARPCLFPGHLSKFLEMGLQSAEGAIMAIPVGDTLKRAGAGGEIIATVDRKGLWAAQTPQLFRMGALAEAVETASREGCELTDEASAMEHAGLRPILIMGSSENIKITHPGDLAIAEALLSRKENR